jgi:transcriptional regulator, propionate catabolism operon regulatory protein
MKVKTLLVAPYRGLMELASSLAAEQSELDLAIVHADLSEILPLLKQYEEDGVEVIISRGGTAKLISQYCSLPVIEIPITGFDMLRMLTMLREYKVKLEMIGFPNIVERFISVSNVMDFDIPHTVIQQESEVESAIESARDRGVTMIVGDSIAVRIAEKYGLQGILITSGREAVLEAFHQAKQIYVLMSRIKRKSSVCEQLMDQLDVGTARLTGEGRIVYANAAFYQLLGIASVDPDLDVFQRFPYLHKLLRQTDEEWTYRDLTIYDAAKKFNMKAIAASELDGGGRGYQIILAPAAASSQSEDMTLHYEVSKYDSLLSWVIGSTNYMRGLLAGADRLSYPITVQGNKGTAKGVYAQSLHFAHTEGEREFLEVRFSKGSMRAYKQLSELLLRMDHTLYITGFELFPLKVQRELMEDLQQYGGKLLFGFDESIRTLYEKKLLDEKIFNWLKKRDAVTIPSLKEMEDFDAIVRSLLVKYNETFGKQIVGIRPQVVELLQSHSWQGDMVELKGVLRDLVRKTEGEYIELESCSFLEQQDAVSGATKGNHKQLDLKQPLKQLVTDIIHIVLEEEGGNQSKAAARLGINRSTLWSKLKEGP